MEKPTLSLQVSEGIVVQSAARIYAAYITSARVEEGHEMKWIHRSIREAYTIARLTDDAIKSDNELS